METRMIITETFTNEEKVLRDTINSLPVVNCIAKYIEYVYSEPVGELETAFVSALYDKRTALFRKAHDEFYKNYTADRLKEELFNQQWDGVWALYDRDDSDLVNYVKEVYTDADAHGYIKELMLNTLDEVIAKKTTTAKEMKISTLKAKYESNKATHKGIIKSYEERQAKIKEELAELGVEI